MKRRDFLTIGAAAMAWGAALAQPGRPARIGVLAMNPRPATPQMEAFTDALRDYGYIEGKNIHIEYRSGDGRTESLRAAAAELAGKVDLIVAFGTPTSLAAKAATSTIPIVMAAAGDPVGTGLVQSLARPGANITGTSNLSPPLVVKRLELLKESHPPLRRAALLMNPGNPAQAATVRAVEQAAAVLKVELKPYGVTSLDDIRTAFVRMHEERMEGVVIANDSVLITNAAAIAFLANKHRLRSAGSGDFAQVGGLIGYGSIGEPLRHAAAYVDKILKGAKPGELPIEQPSKYEVLLNLRTAKLAGFDIPQSFRLLRVDRVVE